MEFEQYLEKANQDTDRFVARTLKKTLKYWWVILLSLLIGFVSAFLSIRYSSKIYSVGAKVMIQVSNKAIDPTALLFEEKGFSNSQDVVDELIILESYPIIKQSVEDASQHIQYFRTTTALERVIQIDAHQSPFQVKTIGGWDLEEPFMGGALIEVVTENDKMILLVENEVIYEGELNTVVELDHAKLSLSFLDTLPEKRISYFFAIQSIEQTIIDYQQKIETSLAEERSSVVNIGLEGVIPEREIRFLQIMLDNYLEANLQEKNMGAQNTIKFIDSELAIIKDSLKKIEGRLEVFKSRNQISNLQTEGQRIFEKLLVLEEEKALLQLQGKYLELIDGYLADNEISKLVSPASFGVEDPSLSKLTDDLLKLETERNLMGKTSESQIAAQYDARIEELKRLLTNYIQNVNATNKIQLQDVNKRVAIIESAIQGLPVSEMALMNIERLHTLSESLYLLLLEKKAEAEITKSSNTPDIKIVEHARKLSLKPIKPNKPVIYAGYILAGLILPLLWILVSVFLDNTIQDKEEITRVLDIPFMGFITSAGDRPKRYIVGHPKSRLAESFRGLRSNLKYLEASEGGRVVLLSSCFPGEGKTFVSANLALSAATSGLKVVIIGADLRKPKLHEHFDLKNEKGLSNYLVGNASLDEVLRKTEDGLHVITSGPNPPNPLELLDSKKFTDLIAALKNSYDLVLIDTSPFMLVADARILFRKVDVNLIVMRSEFSKRSNLSLVKEMIPDFPSTRFGIILNDQKMESRYGYNNSKSYNGYGYYDEA